MMFRVLNIWTCIILINWKDLALSNKALYTNISNFVNKANTTWKADPNQEYGPVMQFDVLSSGFAPEPEILRTVVETFHKNFKIPDNFDARKKWPHCPSIGEIVNQGKCSCCWAYTTATSMTDRVCIATSGKIKKTFSVETFINCCKHCTRGNGCEGGIPMEAWYYWYASGVPSEQCSPYMKRKNDTPTPCNRNCRLHYGKTWCDDLSFATHIYQLKSIEDIQRDIIENGPLVLQYKAYEDFYTYKQGIYQHKKGVFKGWHAVKVIGWGVDNGVKYWTMANSWSTSWGDNGFFKILRGANECEIENETMITYYTYAATGGANVNLVSLYSLIIPVVIYFSYI